MLHNIFKDHIHRTVMKTQKGGIPNRDRIGNAKKKEWRNTPWH